MGESLKKYFGCETHFPENATLSRDLPRNRDHWKKLKVFVSATNKLFFDERRAGTSSVILAGVWSFKS